MSFLPLRESFSFNHSHLARLIRGTFQFLARVSVVYMVLDEWIMCGAAY